MISKFLSSFSSMDDKYLYRDYICNNTQKVFDSHYLELAHASLIWKIRQSHANTYLHAPNFWKNRGFPVVYNGLPLNANNWYRLNLNEDSFYPIDTGGGFSFISSILGNTHLLHPSDEIIVKINLKKRIGTWRNGELEKYQYFLEGNRLAVENKLFRTLSKYISHKEDDEDNTIYSQIEEIEQKIINDQFQFECLVGISSKNKKQRETILSLIHHSMNDLSGLNSFSLDVANGIDEPFYNNDYLSLNEIKSFISPNDVINITEDVIEKVEEDGDNETVSIEQPTGDEKSIFDLLPLSNIDKNSDDDEFNSVAENIRKTLKRVGITKGKDVELDDQINGLSFVRCQYTIPEDLVFSDVFKKQKDIQVALGVPSLTIEQGDKPDTLAFLIPKQKRKPLYLGNVLSEQKNRNQLSKLDIPFFIGVDPLGKPVFECLSNLAHLLVAGQTGGGKSVWLNQAILTMLISMSPKELQMILIDPKQVEFNQFSGFPHVQKVETDSELANELLEKLILEMEERYELFSRSNARNIKDYNEKNKDKPVPYIVVFIDEFADLRMKQESVVQTVAMLGQKARGAGIHLVVATQRPDAKIIDGFIKDNLPSKISFRLSSNKSYTTIFGTGIPFQLLGKGHGVMKIEGQLKEFEQFQSAAISLDGKEEEQTYKRIISYINKNGYPNINQPPIPIEPVVEEDPLSKLKRIIANTGETRARKLRDEMKTRPNVIKELMDQLIEEGWLIKHEGNKGYELIADEETLDEWRG